jgi:acyl-CoA thioester hydrolase
MSTSDSGPIPGADPARDRPSGGRLDGRTHRLPVRVYWEDTDAGGIVYHASYVRFLERGRTEYLRAFGISQAALAASGDAVLFAVRHMAIDFLKPARLEDELVVETTPVEHRGARLVLAQAVRRGTDVLVEARVTVAAIGPEGRPRRLPAALRAAVGGPADG